MYAAVPAHPPTVPAPANMNHTQYYDYNGHFTGASSSSFRPSKRPRPLTDEEAQAITRNFSRGDFYVGNSAPVRIDSRLPVRLTLGEGNTASLNNARFSDDFAKVTACILLWAKPWCSYSILHVSSRCIISSADRCMLLALFVFSLFTRATCVKYVTLTACFYLDSPSMCTHCII